ncbi:MAG: peptidase M64, partial [Duncaniella sp.]|nr:peptidase M64 [Duncaniella sp.]
MNTLLRSLISLSASLLSLPLLSASLPAATVDNFNRHFADSTLRLDYIFGGDSASTSIMLANHSKVNGWAGRRHNLSSLPLQGNGQITMLDPASGDTLYINSFSTLYQEWLATPESAERPRAFENTFLLPLPHSKVNVEVTLFDCRHNTVARVLHPLDPADNLIADLSSITPAPHRYIRRSSDP